MCYTKKKAQGASREELKTFFKSTTIKCKQCKVALCDVPCFKLFHTAKDYTLQETSVHMFFSFFFFLVMHVQDFVPVSPVQ